jgi:integrase
MNHKIYFLKPRNRWRLEYFKEGKRHRPTFKTKEKAEAEIATVEAEEKTNSSLWATMLPAERSDLFLVLTEVKKAGLTPRQVWEDHKRGHAGDSIIDIASDKAVTECVKSKLDANRRRIYVDKLEWLLLRFIKGREAQSVGGMKTEDVKAFLDGKSPITRKTYTSHLAAFFSFCVRRNYIKKNPCDALDAITIDRKPPKILTLKQCKEALVWTRDNDPEMLCWMTLTLPCGLRPSEADAMPESGLNIKRGIVRVEFGKIRQRNSSRRIVPLTPSAKYWFKECERLKSKWNLPYDLRRFRFRKIMKAVGFDKIPQDILRHTSASYMLAAIGDSGKVAKIFGNSASVMLNHYQALVPRSEGLRFRSLTN